TDFTREDYTRIMVEKFGVTKETVDAFFVYLREMNFYDENQLSNKELFEKFFPGRNDITRFLMEAITYANGSTLDDPAISYGIVFSNFMSKGVYTFTSGTDHLVNKMKEELLSNNVDIKLQTKVEKIHIENGKVQGVMINGKLIKAKAVMSNCNIKSTVLSMVGEEHFRPEFIEQT